MILVLGDVHATGA